MCILQPRCVTFLNLLGHARKVGFHVREVELNTRSAGSPAAKRERIEKSRTHSSNVRVYVLQSRCATPSVALGFSFSTHETQAGLNLPYGMLDSMYSWRTFGYYLELHHERRNFNTFLHWIPIPRNPGGAFYSLGVSFSPNSPTLFPAEVTRKEVGEVGERKGRAKERARHRIRRRTRGQHAARSSAAIITGAFLLAVLPTLSSAGLASVCPACCVRVWEKELRYSSSLLCAFALPPLRAGGALWTERREA